MRHLGVFPVHDVNGGLVALPEVKVTVAEGEFGRGRLEVIESASDLDDPTIVEAETKNTSVQSGNCVSRTRITLRAYARVSV